MAFPKNLLNDGEEVVLDLRPHWSQLTPPIVAAVVFMLIAIAASVYVGGIFALATLVPLALSVLWLLVVYVKWTTKNFVVTTERLIHREGVVAKKGIEIPLDRVQTIKFDQSIFERLIGAGDLLIESAGEGGQNKFEDIRRPGTVQNVIYREIEAYENRKADRMGGRGSAPAALSTSEQLEKLHNLLKDGGITQAEYDAQKARLLS